MIVQILLSLILIVLILVLWQVRRNATAVVKPIKTPTIHNYNVEVPPPANTVDDQATANLKKRRPVFHNDNVLYEREKQRENRGY